MKQEKQMPETIDVEEFKRRLTRFRTIKERFRLPWDYTTSVRALTYAYKHEVELRHCEFKLDEPTKQHICKVVAFLVPPPVPRYGILFCGFPGTGKTTLCQALRWLIKSAYSNTSDEKFLQFVHARDICEIAKRDDREYKRLCRTEMLAIDDLGTEPAEVLSYGNVMIPTIELLSIRYEEQLFTLVTTNLTPKEIRAQYTDRIADRFNEMMGTIVFENASYRSPCEDETTAE